MGDSNAEASMIRTYLDWLLAVPWSKRSEERLDPKHAREVLDKDHAGLDDVKRRITEYLAVRKLRTERGLSDTRRSGAILTLVGPPGTGKTSIGESIARATGGNSFGCRSAASGTKLKSVVIAEPTSARCPAVSFAPCASRHDESRDHARRGRQARRRLARRPSAALLEVLDPAQNHAFQDHYLDVELDLSHVLFIATANVAETIPDPFWIAWKYSLRRVHDGREGARSLAATCGRVRSNGTACASTKSRSMTRCCDGWSPTNARSRRPAT